METAGKKSWSSSLGIVWLAVAIEIAGILWDRRFHSMHPRLALERPEDMLAAHWIMYLGMIFIAGSALMVAGRVPGLAPRVLAFGALLQLFGAAWDVIAHAGGREAIVAHQVGTIGILLVLGSLVWLSVLGILKVRTRK